MLLLSQFCPHFIAEDMVFFIFSTRRITLSCPKLLDSGKNVAVRMCFFYYKRPSEIFFCLLLLDSGKNIEVQKCHAELNSAEFRLLWFCPHFKPKIRHFSFFFCK